MKIAALIHAHKEPEVLRRLVRVLSGGGADVWVNLDLKSSIAPDSVGPARLVRRRIDIRWGDYSQVQAVLNSFAEIEARGGYDYVMYMSGQDYPVWSVDRMARRLEASGGMEFIRWAPLGPGGWDDRGRVDYWHYAGPSRALAAGFRAARGVMKAAGLKRRLPGGLKPFGGSGWFTLSRRAVRAVLEFAEKNPAYAAFMRVAEIPDELFFQTILLNSPFKDSVLDDNGRYVDWSEKLPNPKILTEADFDAIKASGMMLCRKVDSRSLKLMDMLDAAR